jgi:hypothetical protein
MAIVAEHDDTFHLYQLLQPLEHQPWNEPPAVLPSSSGDRADASDCFPGMFVLLSWFSSKGHGPAHHLRYFQPEHRSRVGKTRANPATPEMWSPRIYTYPGDADPIPVVILQCIRPHGHLGCCISSKLYIRLQYYCFDSFSYVRGWNRKIKANISDTA